MVTKVTEDSIREFNQTERPTIIFEHRRIEIPFNTKDQRDELILKYIKALEKKIEDLKKRQFQSNQYSVHEISDEEAQIKIINLLKDTKLNNKNKIDFFDITTKLKLPSNQVERILDKLIEMKIIEEI